MRTITLVVGTTLVAALPAAAQTTRRADTWPPEARAGAAPPASPAPQLTAPRMPALPLAAGPENVTGFDPNGLDLQWQDSRWVLLANGTRVKDFGRREAEGREALRIIRELNLSQHVAIGTPYPVMEYWLASGQTPQGSARNLRLLPLDVDSLRAEQVQGQWCLRDDRRVLFNFGAHEADARKALDAVRRHGFTQVGYVGQPTPAMIYFLGGQSGASRKAIPPAAPANGSPPANVPNPFQRATFAPPPGAGTATPAASAGSIPLARQFGMAGSRLPDLDALAERVPFDHRQVQVRQEQKDWKLMYGGHTLANFGAGERDARQALHAIQFYRFTEQCLVGKPTPTFSYFLSNGRAPQGTMLGLSATSFKPENVTVQRHVNTYVLADGPRTLLSFGDRADDARQVLQAIRQHKFDRVVKLGAGEPTPMTFFVKSH